MPFAVRPLYSRLFRLMRHSGETYHLTDLFWCVSHAPVIFVATSASITRSMLAPACMQLDEDRKAGDWSEWVCGPLQRDDEVGTGFCGGLSPKDRLTLASLPAPPRESLVRINEDLHQLDHETFGMRTTSADGWMAVPLFIAAVAPGFLSRPLLILASSVIFVSEQGCSHLRKANTCPIRSLTVSTKSSVHATTRRQTNWTSPHSVAQKKIVSTTLTGPTVCDVRNKGLLTG